MSTKTGLCAKLFGKADNTPTSDCCDVRIIEEDETSTGSTRSSQQSWNDHDATTLRPES